VISKLALLGVIRSNFARSRRTVVKCVVAELRLVIASEVILRKIIIKRFRVRAPAVFGGI
jgi:hypothetical protein